MAPSGLTETRIGITADTVSAAGALSTPPPTDSTITYTYNGLGEVASQTQATLDYTDYYYDGMGRQTEVLTTPFTDYTAAGVQTATYAYYDGLNDLTRTTVGLR